MRHFDCAGVILPQRREGRRLGVNCRKKCGCFHKPSYRSVNLRSIEPLIAIVLARGMR